MRQQEPRLRRRLGLVSATAVALGAIIGAGVFVVLSQAALLAGFALPLAVLLAAGVAGLNGLSSVQLGVNYPRAGGAYEFGYRVLWPVVGFAAGWLFLLQGLSAGATYTLSFVNYLQPLVPGLPLRAIAVGLALLAVVANIAGLGALEQTNNLLAAIKVGVLVIFIAVGLTAISLSNLQRSPPPRPGGVLEAAALFFFAFSGFARPVTLVEEIRDPARNVPRAVVFALGTTTALYLGVATVSLALVGANSLAASSAPLRAALGPTGQAWAQALISVGGLVAIGSVLLGEIWGLSRLSFAMARRGDLPRLFARLTPGGIPRNAVVIMGGIIALLTATVDLTPVLAASSLSVLVYYGITDWASLRLLPSRRLYPLAIPAAGILGCAALAFSLPVQSLLLVGAGLAAGLLYFVLRHRGR